VGTTIIFKMGKARYAWVTLVPMAWLTTATLTAGWQKLFHADPKIGFLAHADVFQKALDAGTLPAGVKTIEAAQKMILNDQIDAVVCGIFMIITIGIIADGIRLWTNIIRGKKFELHESPYIKSKGDISAGTGHHVA
jgi:carbon starvation protein